MKNCNVAYFGVMGYLQRLRDEMCLVCPTLRLVTYR